jgi:hypothetical protein
MLLSRRKKFVYTKTSKTAGTSIEVYFEKYCMPEGHWTFSHSRDVYEGEAGVVGYRGPEQRKTGWRNHMPAAEIKLLVGEQIWNEYFKFCAIRNPFDKMISGYHHFRKDKDNCSRAGKVKNRLKRFLGRGNPIDLAVGDDDVALFRDWIRKGGWINDRDKYVIDGKVCIDFFIRYEDIENGIRQVCERLSVPFEPSTIPRLKSDTRKRNLAVSQYYDRETIEIVKERYAFELQLFGYSAPSL